ncbi:WhiB family transcriptional regulator [Streptomyces mirabilis]|uniref:WhiB family transcriptional regulator n=1 Tax=Streptomyces sp. NPDC005388 TaxID=3156717 RepID=UPI0033AC1046
MEAGGPLRCGEEPDAYFAAAVRPAAARLLCGGCSHLEACRSYAMEHPELVGVWGATTMRERQAVRRRGVGERGPPGFAGRSRPSGVCRRPGWRCAHRVTGRADQGVTAWRSRRRWWRRLRPR